MTHVSKTRKGYRLIAVTALATVGLIYTSRSTHAQNTPLTLVSGNNLQDPAGYQLSNGTAATAAPANTNDLVFGTGYPASAPFTAFINNNAVTPFSSTFNPGSINDLNTNGAITIQNGFNGSTSAATLTLGGGGSVNSVSGTGTDLLYVAGSAVLTIQGPNPYNTNYGALSIALGQSGTLDIAGTASISSTVSGAYGLNKTGVGTLTLSGSSSITGDLQISGGTVQVPTTADLEGTDSNGLELTTIRNGATLAFTNTSGITAGYLRQFNLSTGGGVIQQNASTFNLEGIITGSGSLTKTGAGIIALAPMNSNGGAIVSTYAGPNYVAGGTLQIDSESAAGVGGTVVGAATLQFYDSLYSSYLASYNQSISINSSQSTIEVGSTATSQSWYMYGQISGAGTLNKTGVGTLLLDYSTGNTFSGGVDISAGTINVIYNSDLPSANTVTLGDSNSGTSSPTLNLASAVSLSNPLVVALESSDNPTLSATGTSYTTFSGPITLNETLTVNTQNNYSNGANYNGSDYAHGGLNITGSISGTGGLTFNGTSGYVTQLLTGTNTYSGLTHVMNNNLVQFGNSGSTDPNSLLSIDSGSTVVLAGLGSAKFGGLTGAGTFSGATFNSTGGAIGASVVSFGYSNDSNDVFSGTLSGGLAITKVGTGTQTFSGSNNYSGSTTVTGGTLTLTGSSALGAVTNNLTINNPNNTSAGTAVVVNLSPTSPTTIGNLIGSAFATPTSGTNSVTLNNSGQTLTINATNTNSYEPFYGVITGAGGLTYNANTTSGQINLYGNNTYTGVTNISGGIVTLWGNDSAATGGFNIGDAGGLEGALFVEPGAIVNSINTISVNNYNASSTYLAYMNVGNGGVATVTNSGTLSINRLGRVDLSSGSTWNQSGSMTVAVNFGSTYYTALTIGGTFNYNGSTSINLSPATSASYAGSAYINILGTGVFSTTQGFSNTVASSGGSANINISGGGTLVLNANIANLTNTSGSSFNVLLDSVGGVINTNGYNTSLSATINNSSGQTGVLTKIGAGTLTLTGTSLYNGSTNVLGGTLAAGATNSLAAQSAFNVAGGTLDASQFNNSIASLTIASTGALNLGFGTQLAVTNLATLAGTLNLTGTVGTLPETLMTYGSETGMFNAVTGVPSNDAIVYNSSALVLVTVTTGPANLTYLNANGIFDTGVSSSFNGSSGPSVFHTGDNVTFDDTFTGPYTVPISGSVSPGSTTFNNSAGNYVVSGTDASSGISGTGSLTKYGTGSVTISTSNNYSGGTFVNGGSLILASANALPSHGSLAITSGASVTINTSSGSVFNPVVGSLSNSGAIDIKNNAMIIQGGNGSSGSITAVTAQVQAAYNGGTWNGSSGSGVITSSTAASDTTHLTAVGIATGFTTFEGQAVNSSDVLVKYTYYGDANLDGHVDGSDYSRIDNAVAMGGLTGWANGDFNYDGVINGSDYTLIDNAYNMQGAAFASEFASPTAVATAQIAGGISAVPEPTSLGLIGLAGLGLLRRRRRV